MIVVADTSPIHYLVQLGGADLLPALYGRVLLPSAVAEELRHPKAAAEIAPWLASLPVWISVEPPIPNPDPELAFLDPGEREAIQIAEEHRPSLLLIDEKRGRREAVRRGLPFTGTLGVLAAADKIGKVDGVKMYSRLISETPFRTSASLEMEELRSGRI
jgi:predicted nucleic acid-binding protein